MRRVMFALFSRAALKGMIGLDCFGAGTESGIPALSETGPALAKHRLPQAGLTVAVFASDVVTV